ncbi:DUF2796 domain-containing protein [Alkalimarinus alittae]|uniref:DUF2796 domain-containing protein n=1 Tax=Alkalimarinus alittae TaxID=2961619 RepID=A0ABY6N072_9ALTE|nr:DUF2796 domain-containing protein [Alkalimarinus alittae]UZE95486.1 DUF2796 domain-containing protein [Alkalimarinus alittae]
MKHVSSIQTPFAFFMLVSLISAPSLYASDHEDHHEHREHGAHNHGHATLSIVQEDNNVQLMLESPAANLIGFEHTPNTLEEKKMADKALITLRQGPMLFSFPPNAQCAQTSVEIESALTEHTEDHDSHSDITVSYQFACNNPSALKSIDVQVFTLFPLTEEIDAQIMTDKRQFAAELTAQQSIINF